MNYAPRTTAEKREAGPEGPAPIAVQSTLIDSEWLSGYYLALDLRQSGIGSFQGSPDRIGGGAALVAGITQGRRAGEAERLAPGAVAVVELENNKSQSLSRSH